MLSLYTVMNLTRKVLGIKEMFPQCVFLKWMMALCLRIEVRGVRKAFQLLGKEIGELLVQKEQRNGMVSIYQLQKSSIKRERDLFYQQKRKKLRVLGMVKKNMTAA